MNALTPKELRGLSSTCDSKGRYLTTGQLNDLADHIENLEKAIVTLATGPKFARQKLRDLDRILLEVDQNLPAVDYTQDEVRSVIKALDAEIRKGPPQMRRSFGNIREEISHGSTDHLYSFDEMKLVFGRFTAGGDYRTIDKIREGLEAGVSEFRPNEMRMVLMALDQAKSLWPEAPRSISNIMEECKEYRPVQTRFYSREEMTAVLKFYRAFDRPYGTPDQIRKSFIQGHAVYSRAEMQMVIHDWDEQIRFNDEIRTRQWDMDTIIEHLEKYDGYYSASEMRLMTKDWMALRTWNTDGECVMEEARDGNDRFFSLKEVRNLCDYYEGRSPAPLLIRTPKTSLGQIIEFHCRPSGKGMYFESEVAILMQEIKNRDTKLHIIATTLSK